MAKVGENRGNAGKGRPKGAKNKTTALLKDAILLAAEQEGQDGKGKDGLVGYCRMLSRDEKKAFAQLIGKVLPTQVEGELGVTINRNTIYEAKPDDIG